MLKGKTTLEMNKATMIAALQMYLDSTFKESHVVTDVKLSTVNSGYNSGSVFTVDLDDGASAAKAA